MSHSIRRSSAPVTPELVQDFEQHFHVSLPEEYRSFLLRTNGGIPSHDQVSYEGKSGQKRAKLLGLYGLGREGLVDAAFHDLLTANIERPHAMPTTHLFIGRCETAMNYGQLVLACGGDDAGKVFYRPDTDDDKPTLYPVAESFDAFLAGLKSEGKKEVKAWRQAIYAGDLEALKRAMAESPKPLRMENLAEVAREEGQWEILRYLLTEADRKDQLDAGEQVVLALRENRYGIAKQLLTHCEINSQRVSDCLAGAERFLWLDLDLVRMLITAGAEVNPDDQDRPSPLHGAVASTRPEAVELMLEHGADPTVRDEDNRTPLQLAQRLEETRIAQRLREYQAEWKQRNPQSQEPSTRPFDLHGLTFQRTGMTITLEEIQAVEKELRIEFTPEYRWLLLEANGSILSSSLLPYERPDNDEDEESGEPGYLRVTLFPLRQDDCPDAWDDGLDDESHPPPQRLSQSVVEANGWYHDGSSIPRGTVPIGTLDGYGYEDHGFLLLACTGKRRGQLLGFDHNPEPLNLTLPELFAKLAEEGRKPKPAVERLADAIAARDLAAMVEIFRTEKDIPAGTRDGRMPIRMLYEMNFVEGLHAAVDAKWQMEHLASDSINFDQAEILKRCLREGKLPRELIGELRNYPFVVRDPELRDLLTERKVKWNKSGKFVPHLAHVAAQSGSLEALQFAIAQGADLHYRDKQEGQTSLIAACMARGSDPVEVVRFLLDQGVKPLQWTSRGETALHWAVSNGHLESAKLLIDAGESLFTRYELYAEGMTIEESRKLMGRGLAAMDKMMAEMEANLDEMDDDPPPPPDTSLPEGEKAAEMLDLIAQAQQNMGGMMDQLRQQAQHQQDEGMRGEPANAQRWYRHPAEAERILPILEAYERARRGG